ncbi:MAG: pyruvate carboxyltransferase [Desulfobulbaceae bacterium]|nr:pyruvate carboxyltransferase [Desulfobulbaceae bacterium]
MPGLIDSTLREGEQGVGTRFSLADKVRIVRLLAKLGIEEIELGIAGGTHRLEELIRQCRSVRPQTRLALWCRCRTEDIRGAARLRPEVLSLSMPASDLHLEQRLGRDREWATSALRSAIGQARALGVINISVGIEDASRAEPRFVDTLARLATEAGANRIRLADTVGICSPARMGELVRRVRRVTPIAIGVHCHNDFGMATANTVAALEAGAQWGDVTVLGLGERAGLARLEEVVGYLALGRGRHHYRTTLLKPLAATVARAANRPIAPHQPVVGATIFACETGLHLQGLLRNPATYEPFAPERVGASRQLFFGDKVGKRAVQELMASKGKPVAQAGLDLLANAIRREARERQRPLTEIELCRLADTIPDEPAASA